ncbi:hypothetical protein AVEN_191139-1 [Araneus ventricosus]|uniref:Uncharacterized protein n=1 Tax=Araneus ventricosus TaxID=182803 RepID=A0A4Y2AYN9_ARAVE|nr:hypothetical protein AVEN_191139-1 [Araneus ventricosus]
MVRRVFSSMKLVSWIAGIGCSGRSIRADTTQIRGLQTRISSVGWNCKRCSISKNRSSIYKQRRNGRWMQGLFISTAPKYNNTDYQMHMSPLAHSVHQWK